MMKLAFNRPRVRGIFAPAAVICLLFGAVTFSLARADGAKQPLTVTASFATTRPMTDEKDNPIFISPDGKRYVILLIRGDVERDGIVATLLSGELTSLDRAAQPSKIAEFFTRALRPTNVPAEAGSFPLVHPGENPPQWLDESHVAFYWEDERAVRQIVSVNVDTREVRFLTRQSTPVVELSVGPRGDLIYAAMAPDSRPQSRALMEAGFAVHNLDLMTVLTGDVSDTSMFDRLTSSEYFIVPARGTEARKITVANGVLNRAISRTSPAFSPDGRWAIVRQTAGEVPSTWGEYDLGSWWRQSVRTHATDPLAPGARSITQYYLVDVAGALARPLWNVPLWSGRTSLAWSPNSRSVVIGPSALPLPQTDEAALTGCAVAEVDVATGRYRRLPIAADVAPTIREVRWLSNSRVAVSLKDGSALLFRKANGVWRTDSPSPKSDALDSTLARAPVRIELRQDMNTPPVFYAVESSTGREQVALDPNPQLHDFTLGRVEMVRWRDAANQSWTGRIYYPVDYQPSQRYPLVVQTYGAPPETQFSLGGNRPGIGPGWATRIAQPLANRGIMVLQLGGPDSIGVSTVGAANLAMQAAGREAGIRHLIDRGLVDGRRVGIEGFSSTGRQLEHALAFSDFPYAAAVINDHGDNNYVQSISQMIPAKSFPDVVPFGPEGMKQFLEYSPAWNAERIRAPVQLVINGPGHNAVLFSWEMFARLRYLKKPVEMYVAPDVERGNHELQNPRQSIAVQQRGLDWWCFWLKDAEDPHPDKVGQYESWRKLRLLRDADLQKPRAPMLTWKATPKVPATAVAE